MQNKRAPKALPRVLLDLMASKSIYNGLGQLSLHLSNALVSHYGNEFSFNGLAPLKSHEFFNARLQLRTMSKYARKYCPGKLLSFFSNNWQYDLWHVTNQNSIYFPYDSDTPVILTIHDLNFLRDLSDKRRIAKKIAVLQRRVDRASVITTGSWFAKGEIEHYLELKGKPILVIYHGSLDETCEAVKPRIVGLSSQEKPSFFFSIGEFRPSKNFTVLLHMLKKLPGENLILAGGHETPYGQEVKQLAAELGIEDRVFLLGKITNKEKKWLYENAKALFFPSMNEGFGLPVIEGLSSGLPVFCSDATSLPEIGGGYTFEWDTFDPEIMADKVRSGLDYFNAHSEFRAAAYQYGKSFTWDKAASQYAALYRYFLSGNRHQLLSVGENTIERNKPMSHKVNNRSISWN